MWLPRPFFGKPDHRTARATPCDPRARGPGHDWAEACPLSESNQGLERQGQIGETGGRGGMVNQGDRRASRETAGTITTAFTAHWSATRLSSAAGSSSETERRRGSLVTTLTRKVKVQPSSSGFESDPRGAQRSRT